MYASVWPSEAAAPSIPASLAPHAAPEGGPAQRQRALGRVSLGVTGMDGATRPVTIAEAGSLRVRIPNTPGQSLEAVLINTAGGIACGDAYRIDMEASEGGHLVVATPAAEKVYRSDGAVSNVDVLLSVGAGSRLDWMPQETLLFDRARLKRRFEVMMAEDASLLMAEIVMLGRTARGERMNEGLIHDRWSIRRGGRLIYADAFRLDGDIGAKIARPSIAGGAAALATIVCVAPDATKRLDEARSFLDDADVEWGASAWNGLLALRFLSPEIGALRRVLVRFLSRFRGEPLPRVWMS